MRKARRTTLFVLMALLVLSISTSALPALACDGDCCPSKCRPVGTPGYWMNHPDAWPVDEIKVGGVLYAKDQAIAIMKDPVKRDKTYTMFPALVAAMLNGYHNCDGYKSCIKDTVAQANRWIEHYGFGVKASSPAWQVKGEPLYWALDAYNNGELCAPSRD